MGRLLLAPTLAFGGRVALAVLVVFGVMGLAAYTGVASTPTPIEYFGMADDDTLVVGVRTGDLTWTRVTHVQETDHSVSITVRSSTLRVAMADVEELTLLELTVDLRQALGNRSVVDGSDGFEVRCRSGGRSTQVVCLDIAGR